eukprot:6001024-Prymnesium_polylepis.1
MVVDSREARRLADAIERRRELDEQALATREAIEPVLNLQPAYQQSMREVVGIQQTLVGEYQRQTAAAVSQTGLLNQHLNQEADRQARAAWVDALTKVAALNDPAAGSDAARAQLLAFVQTGPSQFVTQPIAPPPPPPPPGPPPY